MGRWIKRQVPWTSQPQLPVLVDYSGIGKGLKHLFSPPDAAGTRNIVSGTAATKVGNGFTVEASRIGLVNKNAATTDYYTDPCTLTGYPFTLFIAAYTTSTMGGGTLLSIYKAGTGALFLRTVSNFAGTNYPAFSIADATVISSSSHNLVNDPHVIAVVCRSSTDHELYVDGVSVGTSSTAGPAIDTTYKIGLGYKTDQNWVSVGRNPNTYSSLAGVYNRALSAAEIDSLCKHINSVNAVFQPQTRNIWVASAGGSAALTGTITTATEADIVTGGKTIILTLTGDTWIAAGTGPIGSTANTQALIDGLDSAQAEAAGWDAVVKAGIATTDVVRTSDTVATITLPAFASYDITATETITCTIPAATVTLAAQIVAAPTFSVTATSAGFKPYWALPRTKSIGMGCR